MPYSNNVYVIISSQNMMPRCVFTSKNKAALFLASGVHAHGELDDAEIPLGSRDNSACPLEIRAGYNDVDVGNRLTFFAEDTSLEVASCLLSLDDNNVEQKDCCGVRDCDSHGKPLQ